MSSLGPTVDDAHSLKVIGSSGDRHAGFLGVIGLIAADADELSDIADAGAKAQVYLQSPIDDR